VVASTWFDYAHQAKPATAINNRGLSGVEVPATDNRGLSVVETPEKNKRICKHKNSIMKKQLNILLIIVLCGMYGLQAQNNHFSQFFNNPLSINPALTGNFDEFARAGISYRNQWAAVLVNPFETIGFEAEMKITEPSEKAGPLSFGLCVLRDKAGASKFTVSNIMLSLGYLQQLSRQHYLGAGIQGGFGQYNLNYANLNWGNQYNPLTNEFDASITSLEPNIQNKFNHFNVAGGINYIYKTSNFKRTKNEGLMFNAGGSFSQYIIPKNSFYENVKSNIVGRYVLHAESYIGLSQYHLGIVPRVLFASHASVNEVVIGSTINYRAQKESAAFNLGCYYRLGDAVIPYVGLEFSNFNLGFTYDANTSNLGKFVKNTNGLEINLIYNLNKDNFKASF